MTRKLFDEQKDADLALEIGAEYRVDHARKGMFHIKVESVQGLFVTGLIMQGRAEAIRRENTRSAGQQITFSGHLATFTKVVRAQL